MRTKTRPLPTILGVAATALAIALALFQGYRTLAPDVYIPTPIEEYKARMEGIRSGYPRPQ